MKITIFTSNQPRHNALINALSFISDNVYAVVECNTIFPGLVSDFYQKSDIMQHYFSHVIQAEEDVFGKVNFFSKNVTSLPIKMGDLNKLDFEILKPALDSDYYIVFGSSYIKGDLIDFLVAKKALNIHMGLSPFYRGSGCNFWALYDKSPDHVGATIHLLTKGLDSGPMLFHALPKSEKTDAFSLGMNAVKSAHQGLVKNIKSGNINKMKPIIQNKNLEIRYSRYTEFHDGVVQSYLEKMPSEDEIFQSLSSRDESILINPNYGI